MNTPSVIAGLSLVLGLASLFLGALTGVPAVALGLWALRRINLSDGQFRGARLAVIGLVAGSVGVLVTLAGIIALALLQLRQSSQRADCQNNLRLVGAALNLHADNHNTFPAAALGPAKLPPEKRVSWMAAVVGLLDAGGTERKSAYRRRLAELHAELGASIDLGAAWDSKANAEARSTPVKYFLCPGHPEFSARAAVTHYVGIAGLGSDAASLNRQDARAGVFGYGRGVTRDEAEGGTSHTLAVLETAHENGPWLAAGFPTARGLEADGKEQLGPGRPFGGMHPGVTQALWLDGSAQPIRDDVDAGVLRGMATLRRAE